MMASSARVRVRLISIIGIIWLSIASNIHSQEDLNLSQNANKEVGRADENFKIKVDVEEVRLDVVVLDDNGRQITDLTADDFKIYQNGIFQEITSCRYISQDQIQPDNQPSLSPDFEKIAPISATALKRDAVQRSIVFLVHDYNMSFRGVYDTREALRRYVEEIMQPGDLVSILKTSGGSATLQAFTSNKRELLARINNILWKPGYKLEPPDEDTFFDDESDGEDESDEDESDFFDDEQDFDWESYIDVKPDLQEIAIEYCIQALKDMPGRKYIMLATPRVSIGNDYFGRQNYKKLSRYKALADMALRAGIVIHTLHTKGLSVGGPAVPGSEALIPLSQHTGGLFYVGFNFMFDGIRDANELMKGYYVLSYIPPENTFSKPDKNKYHDIEVTLKSWNMRRRSTVYTRDGFYTVPPVIRATSGAPSPPPLVEIMFSPFQYNDLNVSLATGYVDNLLEGYLLPTWMRLDGSNLRVIEEADGSHSVSFEVGASTTDIDGIFQDYGDMRIGFRVDEQDIQKLREYGINFTVSIPVKKEGGHYVRVAIKDRFSDAKGSAYEFIEIPDLKKDRLALSSLYIIDNERDASWIRSMTSDKSSEPSEVSLPPRYRNPAHKEFRPGESFDYMTVIYNAKTKKANPPDLESQIVLYRNGIRLFNSEVQEVDLSGVRDFKRIPVRKTLKIEDTMQSGDYVLQFLVKDRKAKEKESLAVQTLDFRITAH